MQASKESVPRAPGRGARGPLPKKRDAIVTFVRNAVACGRCAPGAQLPDRDWYMRRFGATRGTVQKAFDRLAAGGWTVAVRHSGTRVADKPPFVGRFLLVLTGTDGAPRESLFDRALEASAHRLEAERGLRFDIRALLDEGVDSPAYAAALDDVRAQRYAGVFLRALSSNRGRDTFGAVDRVPISGFFRADPRASGSLVHPLSSSESDEAILSRAFSRLFDECVQARRHDVLIVSPTATPDPEPALRALAERRGLRCGPDAFHTSDTAPDSLRELTRLFRALLRFGGPQAVVLGDDNFVAPLEQALRELDSSGTARRPYVVACGNLPLLPATSLHVRFHGIDTYHTLAAFVDWANALRRGDKTVPPPRVALF